MLFGEGDFIIKKDRQLALLYKRVGMRIALPIGSISRD